MFLEPVVSILLSLYLTVKWPLADVQSKCVGLCPEGRQTFCVCLGRVRYTKMVDYHYSDLLVVDLDFRPNVLLFVII
jgi:hypothetical protein